MNVYLDSVVVTVILVVLVRQMTWGHKKTN